VIRIGFFSAIFSCIKLLRRPALSIEATPFATVRCCSGNPGGNLHLLEGVSTVVRNVLPIPFFARRHLTLAFIGLLIVLIILKLVLCRYSVNAIHVLFFFLLI
jgi:hypothetical protein